MLAGRKFAIAEIWGWGGVYRHLCTDQEIPCMLGEGIYIGDLVYLQVILYFWIVYSCGVCGKNFVINLGFAVWQVQTRFGTVST